MHTDVNSIELTFQAFLIGWLRFFSRFAPIGGTHLYKKQLGMFLQIFNILRKKGEINFKIGEIRSAFVLILHCLEVRNSINKKGSYD
jgi:hypothetical protein